MKRKILILVLCLCTILFTACSQKDGLVLSLGEYQGVVGDTVTVDIHVTENSQIAAADLEVTFDSSALSYVSFKAGESFQNGVADANLTQDGLVKICLATLTPQEQEGTLATLTFTVKDSAKGKSDLGLACTTCCDSATKPITVQCEGGTFSVIQ
jgi:hypothetical protein